MKNLTLVYNRHNLLSDPPPSELLPYPIPYCDLTLVLKGRLEYSLGGREITVSAGDMIYMPVGTLRMRKSSTEYADYISFNFTADQPIDLPWHLTKAVQSEVLLLIAAFDEFNSGFGLNKEEKNKHLLACLLSVLEDAARKRQFNPLVLQIMEYIHKNLDQRITLEDIGRLTFFSPIYCDTVFKRETGRSIIDYLLDKRVEEAKRMLLEGVLTLPQIADAVGFHDYNYFSRVFKARSGSTPSAYRKSLYGISHRKR